MAMSAHGWRRFLTGANAGLVMALVLAGLALLVDLSARFHRVWDFSEDASASLRPDTLGVLSNIDARGVDVHITAFSAQRRDAEADQRDRLVRDLLHELDAVSERVSTEFVPFDEQPATAERLHVTRYGTIVVEAGDRRIDVAERDVFNARGKGETRELRFTGEASLGRALAQISRDDLPVVYVLAGHGERGLEAGGPGGLASLADLLGDQGYSVQELDLLDRRDAGPPAIPADARAVLICGPTAPITPAEEEALRTFVQGGGGLVAMLDPGNLVPGIVEAAGVTVPAGIVYDEVYSWPDADRPVLSIRNHPITEAAAEAELVPIAMRAAPLEVHRLDGRDAVDFMQTTRTGWIERGAERPAVHDPDDGGGPVTVGTAIQIVTDRGSTRVVVIGDADFGSDEMLAEAPGNSSIAVNAVRWVAGDDERIGLVARPVQVRRLAMSDADVMRVRGVVMLAVPLLPLLIGAIVLRSRRRSR